MAADSPTPSLLDTYLALAHIGVASGPLAPLAGEAPEETPRLHIAHTADGAWRAFIRPDVPDDIRSQLAALSPEVLFSDYTRVAGVLARGDARAQAASLAEGLWVGRTLLFPDDQTLARIQIPDLVRLPPGADHYASVLPDDAPLRPARIPANEPLPARAVFPREQFAALKGRVVVATCESSRESALAAEAWVRTVPQMRGRGYATRVTAAWALDVRRRGKTPFYSHHRDNHASAGVARALGLIPFLEDVGYL
jgi:RimJ/RimL family protein N-acetyltransferase